LAFPAKRHKRKEKANQRFQKRKISEKPIDPRIKRGAIKRGLHKEVKKVK